MGNFGSSLQLYNKAWHLLLLLLGGPYGMPLTGEVMAQYLSAADQQRLLHYSGAVQARYAACTGALQRLGGGAAASLSGR